MIKPQEICLGNWININGSPFQIELPDLNLIANKKGKITYDPIELNEDWILNFKFIKLSHGYVYHFGANKSIEITLKMNIYLRGMDVKYINQCFIVEHVKYVHQLQNLYFALTGEELKIKE